MKKIVLVFTAFVTALSVSAQNKKNSSDVLNRAGDHIMIQLGTEIWTGTPDSINNRRTGLSRGANIYVMKDKVFKGDKRFSVAFGVGVSSSNVYFKNYKVDIISTSSKLPFINLDSSNRFKKYKLSTAFLEVPLELRFTNKPDNAAKSIKGAIGVKVGTTINVHTKGKTLQNKSGGTVSNYVEKLSYPSADRA
ncbi:MAG: outer membrane beta-barrel protein [Pseudanabaena sp. RU_4_16]|nr:outer membrane beta-barrel protein [Pseudanabaena sp. RU_4_16]